MKLKVLELFSGIGALSKALERLGIEHEIVDAVEIDKYAVKSFNAIHNTNFESQDICEWNKDIEVDLIMHGSPCQDFSLAGKQAGGDEESGTRSSLMYETIRIVEKLKPKYVIWENVKNLLSKKHRHNFDAYLETMEQLGYTNYYQVLNAKDYGIPQNRERVFTVSIRKDIDKGYVFPQPQELKLRLKDMLEEEVDEKYYLSGERLAIVNKNIKVDNEEFIIGSSQKNASINYDGVCPTLTSAMGLGGGQTPMIPILKQVAQMYGTEKELNPQAGRIYDSEGISPTMDSCSGGNRMPKILIRNATKKGYQEAYEGDGVNISSRMKYQRGNVQKDSIQTITTSGGNDRGVVVDKTLCLNSKGGRNGVEGLQPSLKDRIYDSNGIATCCATSNFFMPNYTDGLRIRKLTPKECWRLMGFDDEDFEKASKVNSNTQLYKQAGNSIVVNVLEAILTNLLK